MHLCVKLAQALPAWLPASVLLVSQTADKQMFICWELGDLVVNLARHVTLGHSQ